MKIIAAAADRRLSNPDRGEPTMHSPSTVWPAHGVSDALRRDCLNLARRNSAPTFYGSLGGDPAMRKLADQFVAAAADNPHLRPLLGAEAAAVADRLYGLFATVGRLAEARVVTREDAGRWSDGLRAADGEGLFFSALTGFLVSGARPDDDGPGS